MTIPHEKAQEIIQSYRIGRIENLFAQSSASHVLYEVGETENNFPQFDSNLVDKVTASAYSILAAGVSLSEVQFNDEAIHAMEEAATLLNNVHAPHAETSLSSSFHVLIASMAFHAAGQYSRAFVCIRKTESQTDLARIVASLLRKRAQGVIEIVNKYTLADLSEMTDPWLLCEHAVTLAIARAASVFLEYFATGNNDHVDVCTENLNVALELALDYESPSHWWVARLFRLMLSRNMEASLWHTLPTYFQGDLALLDRYIKLHVFGKNSVTELWHSQLDAITVALDQGRPGAVLNMRTSSGKTRVAELAILQTLNENPAAKILYLAPFRSLALEIEHTLGQIFDPCGFHVSHLYGGFRFGSADRKMAEESSITIATPEKTRAILRSSPELLSDIKLIIIDEGHLIGADERYVKNELFVEHLRALTEVTGCRILMLSAVLPNPEDLATWLTGASENVAKSEWKPSSERFGLLRWQGDRVRIDWRGGFESFNPSFVISGPLGWGRRRKPFPSNKNEAVAATAIRLSSVGPVMIFSARANSIPGLANAVLMAMGEKPEEYEWPTNEWAAFVATCEEELAVDAIELQAARCGIICHSNKLPSQVRMATERLMRSKAPKIIIASSTLAQGVNVGISSVIVSTPYKTKEPIDHRDFWNICGRAGRAYVDGEGKILYAIDETRAKWQIRKDAELANKYFDRSKNNPVESGLLYALGMIHRIAENSGVDFGHLMTMVAENDFTGLGDFELNCAYIMDLIDDALLALNEDSDINRDYEGPEIWADRVFRSSLAVIQAENSGFSIDSDQLIRFLTSRAKYVLASTPEPAQRKAYVASGLPVSSASNLYKDRDQFIAQAQTVLDSGETIESISYFIAWLEEWARRNATGVIDSLPGKNILDFIRNPWLSGRPMRELMALSDEAGDVCKEVYGFQLPWLLHAAAQQVKQVGYEDLSETLSKISLLVELGVPSEKAAWIFLAGVRSRASASELAVCGIDLGDSSSRVRRNLRKSEVLEELRALANARTQAWLDLHWSDSVRLPVDLPSFPRFTVDQLPDEDYLLVRRNNESVYLCSADGRDRMAVKVSEKWPFDRIADDYRFAFQKSGGGIFDLVSRDPRIEV